MANINELKEALKDTLEERGVLNEVRAMMRNAIFQAIELDDKPKPKLTNENEIINELIREYLIYNNYLHTHSTFMAESGQPPESQFDRNFIASQLNIKEESSNKKIPLLYLILFGLKDQNYQPNLMNDNNNFMNSNNQTGGFTQSSNILMQNQDQPQPWNFNK